MSRTSAQLALMESRLGSNAIRAREQTIRLRGMAYVFGFFGSLVTMAFAAYASSGVCDVEASVYFLIGVAIMSRSVAADKRAVQLLLDRYDLPFTVSKVTLLTWRDPVAFDKWLAESRMAVLNSRTQRVDDPPV